MADKRKALGRGLRALIPDVPAIDPNRDPPLTQEVDLDLLRPNRDQPRGAGQETALDDLAQSIRAHGVIQPIVVARRGGGEHGYEIVAGERRWRAAQRAGLLRVPVVVRDVPATRRLELALIENIQREDLNPMEEAAAYARLADDFGLTQEQIARSVGKDRATIANYQRLLGLPKEVQAEVTAGRLTMGHARALASLTDAAAQQRAAREIIAGDLSVRDAEALVRKAATSSRTRPPKKAEPRDVHVQAAETTLRRALGAPVRIVQRGKAGRIEIAFKSDNELQRLYEHLTRR